MGSQILIIVSVTPDLLGIQRLMLKAAKHCVQLSLLVLDPSQWHLLSTLDLSHIHEVVVFDVSNPDVMLFARAVAPDQDQDAHVLKLALTYLVLDEIDSFPAHDPFCLIVSPV